MCDVVGVLGIFCGVPRESECFYINVVMEQMFLTVRGDVQGSFRVTLGVSPVFVHVLLRPGWGAWRCFHRTPPRFFSSVLI